MSSFAKYERINLDDMIQRPPTLSTTKSNLSSISMTKSNNKNEIDSTEEESEEYEDEENENEDTMSSLPAVNPQIPKESIYSFQQNEKMLKQELVHSMLCRLKVSLSFLLCDESPLWNDNDTNLQKRCSEYNQNLNVPISNKAKSQIINALFCSKYLKEFDTLFKEWNEWKQRGMDENHSMDSMAFHKEIFSKHQILEDDCADFIEARMITKKKENSMMSAFNKLRGKKSESDRFLETSATIHSLGQKLKIEQASNAISESSEQQLLAVRNRSMMKEWIRKFKNKESQMAKSQCFCCCNHCKWISECFGADFFKICSCQCRLSEINESEFENKDFQRIPMDLWSWQNVVKCVEDAKVQNEDGEEVNLKHFASVFWQYRIEGKELVLMNVQSIELLVECWFLNNIEEHLFDSVKNKFQKVNDETEWHLSKEAKHLIKYIDTLRIQSHVVSRYHLSMDIVQLIISEKEDPAENEVLSDDGVIELYEDAINIKKCVDFLRSNVNDGPRAFWKMDSYFFNKIDAFLSVLVCSSEIRSFYMKCFPDFLCEPDENENDFNQNQQHNEEWNVTFSMLSASNTPLINNNGTDTIKQNASLRGGVQSNKNSFLSIQSHINKKQKSMKHLQCTEHPSSINERKFSEDCLDKFVDYLTDDDKFCCFANDSLQNLHNLDRIYLKLGCIVFIAMLIGSGFIIYYYYDHGLMQANDALFLSLEAIGDRGVDLMTFEFYVPQMFASLTIGGLMTGDLVSNASLYSYPNTKYDEFFASFANIPHSDAIYSVFMYNEGYNSIIGAYRHDNDTVMIAHYNGTCRKDRPYSFEKRNRVQSVRFRENCEYDPLKKQWFIKAKELGDSGLSQWTEPYIFDDDKRGMSYVAPIIWKGESLVFVVEVTTETLAVAVSQEIEEIPVGSLWMIVTPGLSAVASNNNQTLINLTSPDVRDGCVTCADTDNPMIVAAINWMKDSPLIGNGPQHFSNLQIDDTEYDISVYTFKMNHINLHPPHGIIDSNEYIIKPLTLNNESDYQFGYFVIVNDQTYVNQVETSWLVCWIWTILAFAGFIILILVNIRYNIIQQSKMGKSSRSMLIRQTSSVRLRAATSNINSFHKQMSKSRSISATGSHDKLVITDSPKIGHYRSPSMDTVNSEESLPCINDRVKTKNNKYGRVKFVGKMDESGDQYSVLLEFEDCKTQKLISLDNIIMNFGQLQRNNSKKAISAPPMTPLVDSKIMHSSLSRLKITSTDEEFEEKFIPSPSGSSDDEPIAGSFDSKKTESASLKQSNTNQTTNSNGHKMQKITFSNSAPLATSNIKKTVSKTMLNTQIILEDPEEDEITHCGCISDERFKSYDDKLKRCCYLPQKLLISVSFLFLCIVLITSILIWEKLTTSATRYLFEEVMAKHEWLAVQDRVFRIIDQSEMYVAVVQNRFYQNNMNNEDMWSLDRYFVNLMQTQIDANGNYFAEFSYMTTPNGTLRGVRTSNPNDSTLYSGIRDSSTNRSYDIFLMNKVTGYTMYETEPIDVSKLYDPRCRGWYFDVIYYAFEGTLDQAFPDGAWDDWMEDDGPTADISNCIDAKLGFEAMWNPNNESNIENWRNNTWHGQGKKDKILWSRYLDATNGNEIGQIVLTASKPIIDETNGNLLAIASVDYTLRALSKSLHSTTQNPHDTNNRTNYQNWVSWIFDAASFELIASSDGEVLRDASSTEGCYGVLVTQENTRVPYNALEHSNDIIRVNSKQVINVSLIENLKINGTEPESIRIPGGDSGQVFLEAGRVQFDQHQGAFIDWVILKTLDVEGSFVDDLMITLISSLLVMSCVWVLLVQLDYSEKLDTNLLINSNEKQQKKLEKLMQMDEKPRYELIMSKMKPIILNAANIQWRQMINKQEASLNEEGKCHLITTEKAKNFLANKANEFVTTKNENSKIFRECAWRACDYRNFGKLFQQKFWNFIESNFYDITVQLCMLGHLAITFFEPTTPKLLKEEGLGRNVLFILSLAQFIQWTDAILIGFKRYFEYNLKEPYLTSLFELNYGATHKYTIRIRESAKIQNEKVRALYLVFAGPQCRRYLFHLLFVLLDLVNFILQTCFYFAPFSYFFPILPFLIIVRNNHIMMWGYDFFVAIIYAKDVIFSYFCFILIFAILTISLFRDTVNFDQRADSFQSIDSAFVTGFVFISTSENYAIMYDIFDSEYYANSHWLVLGNVVFICLFFAIMGMFCWIPMIIDKFEQAFEESNMRHNKKNKLRKTNAIIASFVMLDFNGDGDIDPNEFDYLVSCSLLIDKNKLFDVFDENDNARLEVDEFVSCLLKHSFRTKQMGKLGNMASLRFSAWMECNVFRHENYKIYTFVFAVIPVIGLSLTHGLRHEFDSDAINNMIGVFFLFNFFEIMLRCFVYCPERFWDLLKYPEPNYVIAAINKYKGRFDANYDVSMMDASTQNSTIQLTSSQSHWVHRKLRDVRPLSILEKSTQTLVNRLEIVTFVICMTAFFGFDLLFFFHQTKGDKSGEKFGIDDNISAQKINGRYQLYFLQLAVLMRIFTLIPANRKLIYIVFEIYPEFIALFAFLGLFIYAWARIGCTLFGDHKTDIVLPEIYEPAGDMVANFNSLIRAILALLQLMIGEGWHEVMYTNMIATQGMAAIYFIFYITVVSIIIANVFVGLFLADVDDLTREQSDNDIIQRSLKSKSFRPYAYKKMAKLKYQIGVNEHENHLLQKQIDKIEDILYQQSIVQLQSGCSPRG